ncbi:phosphatidate cytidylyltransferase [Devosia soli]|uniref:phosphatidate cytidylyltransferase n=1 Tax=Devosia soli TaxID=361041 RepID=UPI000699DF3D|nr:phosphatidate cytidylyltransferase [Devosia soli]
MTDPGEPSPKPVASQRRNWADVGPRLASAAFLLVIVIVTLYLGSFYFSTVVGAVYAGAYREWETMVSRATISIPGLALVALVWLSGTVFPWFGILGLASAILVAIVVAAFMDRKLLLWRATGLALFGLLILSHVLMRGDTMAGLWAGVFLGTVVWMTDSAAFFTGRQIGGEKLAPAISPSKTWSGALGGLALGAGAGLIVWTLITDSPWWIGLLIAVAISILGQFGDLLESAVKRRFRIKDSGDIIPGHGGLMDRLDSLTFGVILVLIIGVLHGGIDRVAEGLLYW